MKLQFDLTAVTLAEFGVGKDNDDGRVYVYVPADASVQQALREMAVETWNAMSANSKDPDQYDPSEKHGGIEHLYLPLTDAMGAGMKALHEAVNLTPDTSVLADPAAVYCYFARFTDKKGNRLTAVRRATQFKGVLANHLIRWVNDALKIIEDNVFKLDNDFDLLIDGSNIHILRPSGFEFVGQMQSAILEAVPINIHVIQKDIGFVDFDAIGTYAAKHPRAARYLASICAQKEYRNIDKRNLKKLCGSTGVEFKEHQGKLVFEKAHVMGFLEVLDRRRYEIELVKDAPERYRAASRQRIRKSAGGS